MSGKNNPPQSPTESSALHALKDALRPHDLKMRERRRSHQQQVYNQRGEEEQQQSSSFFERAVHSADPSGPMPEDSTMPRPQNLPPAARDARKGSAGDTAAMTGTDITSDGSGGIFETARLGSQRRRRSSDISGSSGGEVTGGQTRPRRGSILDELKPSTAFGSSTSSENQQTVKPSTATQASSAPGAAAPERNGRRGSFVERLTASVVGGGTSEECPGAAADGGQYGGYTWNSGNSSSSSRFPVTGNADDVMTGGIGTTMRGKRGERGGGGGQEDTPRVSALDSQGTIGRQFTVCSCCSILLTCLLLLLLSLFLTD